MSAEELAKKKRVRAGHKASATRMIGSAEDLLKTGIGHFEIDTKRS